MGHRVFKTCSSGFGLERLQRELTSGQPSSLMHLPVAPYVTSNFSTSPYLLSTLFLCTVILFSIPGARAEKKTKTYRKCRAAIEIFGRSSDSGTVRRLLHFLLLLLLLIFSLVFDSVCFVLIISYPQQLHSCITET